MSSEKLANLIKMANQIGSFFETMQDHEKALDDIAQHIHRSWAPPMRSALLEYVAQEGGAELRPMVLEALKKHQADLTPAKAATH
ncbi:MAG TPA: formate dehydrogenase subunit delta [Herbaspirillum sp.]|jgi:formate dehydrogenase subunit delta